jgi:DNA uptake protein ComE-like DNA-binding protein
MGFMDTVKQQFSKNKDKATEQFEKNKHKVAPLVDKATDQVDKVTKGKSAPITSKVDDAARKISGGSATTAGTEPMPTETLADDATTDDPKTS